jgi:hypothetical protein
MIETNQDTARFYTLPAAGHKGIVVTCHAFTFVPLTRAARRDLGPTSCPSARIVRPEAGRYCP